ncbi:MAG TPA: VOC family protein [Nannocystaceae bacterium]|nr:VOC family protein [Nannocystaceae bacterium]
MELGTHLVFSGRCREAFEFYARVFGGTIEGMLAYGDTPMASSVPAEWSAKIVHATLSIDGRKLMGADVLPEDYARPQGFYALFTDEPTKVKAIFEALADGGSVKMPLQATFWSPAFGVVVDRFGVPWEINAEAPHAEP